MTHSPLEELHLQTTLLVQELVELPHASRAIAGPLLARIAGAVRDHGLSAHAADGAALATLRRFELDRLLGEAAGLTHDEPRWHATLRDLRAELESQCLVDDLSRPAEDAAAL